MVMLDQKVVEEKKKLEKKGALAVTYLFV